jgi:ubiquinone/menaquinone biosynthesis C-methylase UbiE
VIHPGNPDGSDSVHWPMGIARAILLRMFGRPHGLLGRLGGRIMARTNRRHARWTVDLLRVEPDDRVLEVGAGPGVAVEILARLARHVSGIDPSAEMLRQATSRIGKAIGEGRVDLRLASVDQLPFPDSSFDKAIAINSMQVWPNPAAGLREIRRVLRPDGRLALTSTAYSGQPREGVLDVATAAGFSDAHIVDGNDAFCALARR